jgi:hypothetical protein
VDASKGKAKAKIAAVLRTIKLTGSTQTHANRLADHTFRAYLVSPTCL